MSVRTVDLTAAEWRSLSQLPTISGVDEISADHRSKLIRLGVAAEKAGRLVTTFEGRLMLREHNNRSFKLNQ